MNPTICQIGIPPVIDFCQAFTAQLMQVPSRPPGMNNFHREIPVCLNGRVGSDLPGTFVEILEK